MRSKGYGDHGRRRLLTGAGVACLATGGALAGLFAGPAQAGVVHATAKAKPTLLERKVGRFGEVLTNSAGRSLYVLSTESKGKLHCTSKSCVNFWPPLLVAKGAHITHGTGVKGKIGWVVRGRKWQVTYNGWPVYTFSGDSGAGQASGEKVVAFGGTWYLVHAAAKTNSATPVKSVPKSGGTTTTTTTTPGW